ncbi:MAG: OmpA family protein [Staphylococcus sp.]|nr:OmpA family protein [Staphylococcus sp.]
MKINKLFLSATLALCAAFGANAQVAEEEVTEYVFQPHWYVQGQVGMQETLGETSFGKLASFNAQLGVGYNFNPVLGARLIFNSWTSKASICIDGKRSNWKWNYIAPSVNLTADLVNLIGGFNPDRKVNAGLFAGIGFNVAYNNDRANNVNAALKESVYAALEPANRPNPLGNIWDGTKVRFLGQFGVFADYAVSNRVKLGLELQANVLPDGYNSKKAPNADWYFNGLVGVKYTFGSSSRKTTRKVAVPVQTQIVEKIVEVPVVKEVIKEVIKEVPAALTRDVFFKISTTKVTKDEMYKVAEIARYLQQNPDAKVTVTGYADKGTGSRALNLRLAAQRAQAVVDALTKDFGIAASRIQAASMGEEEHQPYNTPELNRVAICVAK